MPDLGLIKQEKQADPRAQRRRLHRRGCLKAEAEAGVPHRAVAAQCPSPTLPRPHCAGLFRELRAVATLLNKKSPSPPFRGEREGPRRDRAGEGEVGGAANRLVGPPHPALSPRPAGGEDK